MSRYSNMAALTLQYCTVLDAIGLPNFISQFCRALLTLLTMLTLLILHTLLTLLTEPGLGRPCVPNAPHELDLVTFPGVEPNALGSCHVRPHGSVDGIASVAEEDSQGDGGEAREAGAAVGARVVAWEPAQGPHGLQVAGLLSAHDKESSARATSEWVALGKSRSELRPAGASQGVSPVHGPPLYGPLCMGLLSPAHG